MSFGFGVGDFLAVSQLAFTLYRQCYLVARDAPQEFQSLVTELTALSTSLRLLQDEVADENSLLVRSGEDRLRMMKEMISRVEGTLKQLEKFAGKYAKLLNPGRSKAKKVWDRVKWSAEMADIDGLRNKVRMGISFNYGYSKYCLDVFWILVTNIPFLPHESWSTIMVLFICCSRQLESKFIRIS